MGYGLSEVGGACFLAPPGVNDESFGYPCIPVMMPCMAMQPFGDMSKFRPPFFDDEDDEDADEDDCDERRCHGFPPFGKMGSFRPPFFDDEDDEEDEDADDDECDDEDDDDMPPFMQMGRHAPPQAAVCKGYEKTQVRQSQKA